MENIIAVYKNIGLTPLDAIKILKRKKSEYQNKTISYAGRLDPMAEGMLLLLVGDENKKRQEYQVLKKTYCAQVIFGITTDSFDGMGMIQSVARDSVLDRVQIKQNILALVGKQNQFYPPFSSKVVNGKPLYWWARENRLDEIKLPSKEIEIFSVRNIVLIEKNGMEIARSIIEKIQRVKGEFRQNTIIESWDTFEREYKNQAFFCVEFEVEVSSGTYIRQIASDLGNALGTGAFLFSLVRTKIGHLEIKNCIMIGE